MSLFVSSLLIVALGMAWLFGSAAGRLGEFRLADAFLGLALTPAVIAAVTAIGFAATSFIWPSRAFMTAAPALVVLILVLVNLPFSSRPSWPKLSEMCALLIFLLGIAPFAWATHVAATAGQYGHDISLYLAEASDLSRMMQDGTTGWMGWAHYAHPEIVTPHTKLFQTYMAWGFLFSDQPGFGDDYYPRLLIGISHLSLPAAIVALAGRERLIWGLAAALLVTLDAIWISEINGFSRDTFYIAPAIVVLALLLRATERRDRRMWAGFTLALVAALAGHSLGIIVVAAVAIGAGIVQLFRRRMGVFKLTPFWITVVGVVLATAAVAAEYVLGSPADKGFAFPFYVDPFQQDYFRSRPFAATPNILELTRSLLRTNGILEYLLLLPVLALATVAIISRKITLTGEREWFGVCLSVLVLLAIVTYLPFKVGGAGLAGAFVSNFRYGFSAGVLILALLTLSVAVITEACLRHFTTVKYILPVMLTVTAAAAFISGRTTVGVVAASDTDKAQAQHELCQTLADMGVRRVMLDNDGMIYRCDLDAIYAFTAEGALITGAEGDAAIAVALRDHKVDAVLLLDLIPTLWSGTRLYRYLEANWQQMDIDLPQTFLRPGLTGK